MDSLHGAIIAQSRNPYPGARPPSVLDTPERPTRGRKLQRASQCEIDAVLNALRRLAEHNDRLVGSLVSEALGHPVSRTRLRAMTVPTIQKLWLYVRRAWPAGLEKPPGFDGNPHLGRSHGARGHYRNGGSR